MYEFMNSYMGRRNDMMDLRDFNSPYAGYSQAPQQSYAPQQNHRQQRGGMIGQVARGVDGYQNNQPDKLGRSKGLGGMLGQVAQGVADYRSTTGGQTTYNMNGQQQGGVWSSKLQQVIDGGGLPGLLGQVIRKSQAYK